MFSLPPGTHYLNCAYMAPLSQAVEQAGVAALVRSRYPAEVPPGDYFRWPDAVRQAFARLVHVDDPRRIALLPSVSYAMAVATRNIPAARGQNVVVIGQEFPSAVLPWRRLVRERNLVLRTVDPPRSATPGADWNARLHAAIDAGTAAVVLAHVHWSDGTRFDVKALAARAREVGAVVVVDGTQSVGALPFDVRRVQPDLLVCSGYKWLLSQYGLSVAYFGERFDHGSPLEETWTSQCGSEDFARLAEYRDAYGPMARRYDGGQRASFVLAPMLCAAIEQLLAWDVAKIQRYCERLLAPWLERLTEYGVALAPPEERASHLVGLRVTQSCDLTVLADQLAARQVSVSVRGDVIRVSPHLYNDEHDMAALFATLGQVLGTRVS
jgi:selenocysteine lyase/cysteine desulfurase